MANQVQKARPTGQPTDSEPTLADLLDPVALEARLVEARARRATAIARRNAGIAVESPVGSPIAERPPAVSVASEPASALSPRAEPIYAAPRRRRGGSATPVLLAAIFLFGLVGGGAAVLFAPPDLRQVIADAIAPQPVEATLLDPTEIAAPAASPAAMVEGPTPLPVGSPTPAGVAPGPAALNPAWSPPGAHTRPAAEGVPEGLEIAALAPARLPFPAVLAGIGDGPEARASARATDSPPIGAAAGSPDAPPTPTADAGSPLVDPRFSELLAAPAQPPEVAPLAVAGARIFVHFPPTAAPAAAAAVGILQAAGATDTTAMPVRFSIERPNVRYYHAADRDAALDVAKILGASQDTDAPEARDFTDFRPQPDPGMIEVWLAGGAPATASPRAPARQTVAAPRQVAVSSARAQQKAETIERIVLERAVERMLRERGIAN